MTSEIIYLFKNKTSLAEFNVFFFHFSRKKTHRFICMYNVDNFTNATWLILIINRQLESYKRKKQRTNNSRCREATHILKKKYMKKQHNTIHSKCYKTIIVCMSCIFFKIKRILYFSLHLLFFLCSRVCVAFGYCFAFLFFFFIFLFVVFLFFDTYWMWAFLFEGIATPYIDDA